MKQTMGIGLLLLSGCDVARSARDDLARLTGPSPATSQMRKGAAKPQPAASNTGLHTAPATTAAPAATAAAAALVRDNDTVGANGSQTLAVAGKNEAELRALLGAPTSEEEHPPGKLWRYRDGKCTLDIQLYPDVETKQFGTLAYKVKSDDNTDEGTRLCVAQLQSRIRPQP